MRKTVMATIAAAAMAVGAAPAAAQTYDPAQQGPNAADFVYGYRTGGVFTAYQFPADFTPSGCFNSANVSCLLGGPSDTLGAYFASADGQANTAFLFASDVTLHPGANGEEAVVAFVAPTTRSYRFAGLFRGVDAAAGDGVSVTSPDGTAALAPGGTFAFDFTRTLAAGELASFSVGPAGSYLFDTTGLRLNVTAVPEPAAWALMIVGVGAVGGSLRAARRRRGTPAHA